MGHSMGGPTPAPHTPPVIRTVLLHTEPAAQDLCPGKYCMHIGLIYRNLRM